MILYEHGLHKYVDGDKRKRSHNLQNDKHMTFVYIQNGNSIKTTHCRLIIVSYNPILFHQYKLSELNVIIAVRKLNSIFRFLFSPV